MVVNAPVVSDEKPVIVPAVGVVNMAAVQLNVTGTVPVVGELNAIDAVDPVQIKLLTGVATTVAIGLTVTVTVNVFPVHPFEPIGVTVYVIVTGDVVVLVYTSVMLVADATVLGLPAGTLAALLEATLYV
jgi:hypothetical protein